jgi:AraC-like DNA-binding protein
MVLYDLGRPYAATSKVPYRELRLYVPRELFAARVGRIEDLSGLHLRSGGTFGMFKAYLSAYAAALPTLSEREADIALDGVLHLLSGLVGSVLDAKREEGTDLAVETLLALARQHIQARLADPGLDVAQLARRVGVSRTRLYAAFAGGTGVGTAIRDARLDRVRQRLLSPADRGRTIEHIAMACGFTDYSTFVRAFRRRFGMSPGEWRGQ